MKQSFKRSFMFVITLLALTFSALGTNLAQAAPLETGAPGSFPLYVSKDSPYSAVVKLDAAGAETAFASGFWSTYGLAFDTSGNLYVANGGGSPRPLNKVTPGGVVSTFATVNNSLDVTFDTSGNLYVSQVNDNVILKITPGGGVSMFASINMPWDIQFNSAGNLYVTEVGTNSIKMITPGGVVSTFATGFNFPYGLAFAANGDLYVSDMGNQAIKKVTPGGVISTFATGFVQPRGLTFDTSGNLYVADYNANAVKKVTPGGVVSVFATVSSPTALIFGPDTTAPTVDTFTATTPSSSLNIPITFTASDNTAVTGYLITESATPPLAGAAGWAGTAPATYSVTSTGSYTFYPWAKDAAGNVSAVFGSPQSVTVNPMSASLVLGQANFTSGGAGGGATGMYQPSGVTVDPTTGKIFVGDRVNNRVLRFASAATLTNGAAAEAVLGQPNFSTTTAGWSQSTMYNPMGVAVDSAGRLWVADSNNARVLRFDNASSLASGANANAVLGQTDFVARTSGTAQNKLWSPSSVAVDSAGRLWVADVSNSRVLRFDNAASKANGANADGVLGKSDFVTNSCTWTATTMCSPYGVYMSSTGTLWVADGENYRILRFDNAAAKANGAVADGVLGQPNFTARDNTVTSQNRMSQARGLAFDDSTGTLYVMNGDANRILVFNNAAAKTNGANADNVIGQTNFTNNSSGNSATTLSMPWGGFFDPAQKVLWVTSWNNNRVLMYGTLSTPAAPTVSTDSVETLNNRQVNLTISDLGYPASVTHYGVVYNTTGSPTTSDSTSDNGTAPGTGLYHVGLDGMSLTPGTKYYVRAFATNATGTSYGSELVIYGTPAAFTTTAPANSATGVSTSPTLSWNASTGATDYQYCVAAQIADCAADLIGPNWHSTSGATSVQVSGLLPGTAYVWAVHASVGSPASYKFSSDSPLTFTTATLSATKAITAFDFASPAVSGTITEATHSIAVTVPFGTNVTALVPTITHTGASVSPNSGVAQDFSSPVTYTVTAEDATTQDYTVTVTVALNPAKAITAFTFASPATSGVITEATHTIAVTVPFGTNVTALVPTITHTGASVSPNSGMAQDFTNPLTYTVTAGDATTQDYTVTVTVALNSAKAITAFSFASPAATGTVTEATHTIAVTVPFGTNVTALVPTITHTGASINPNSGVAQNFTNPVTYTVTAADASTQGYTVTVTVTPSTSTFLLPAGWVGSVSITSDKNVTTIGRPHVGSEVASYNGFSEGALTAYIPMLFKNAFGGSYDSAFYVQNVDASNSATIAIKYYDSTGALSCTVNDTVAALASKGYWLPGLSASCLPDGWIGGVVVTSDKNIVANGRPHIGAEVMTYDSFSSGSLTSYLPMLFKSAFGGTYNSAFYVQNVGSSIATVNIKYYDSVTGIETCSANDTIASYASKGYWLPSTCVPANWVGGVVVTSDQPIVTVGRPHIGTQVTTYNGFSTGSLASYVPMLFKGAFGGTYDAALYIQNVGGSSAAITIDYYDLAGNLTCSVDDTITALASKGYWLPSTCLPSNWVGGAVVTSDQPIVAVGRPHIGGQVTTYDGFTSGNLNSYLPMLFKSAFGGTYNSAFYIQNTEASAATVTTKFYDSTGALTCLRNDTLPGFLHSELMGAKSHLFKVTSK